MDIGMSLATGVVIGLLIHVYSYVSYIPNKISDAMSYVTSSEKSEIVADLENKTE